MNENPLLTTMHTIFVREHNRLARSIKDLAPHFCDETLFQEARYEIFHQTSFHLQKELRFNLRFDVRDFCRRILIAEWQNIVYNEFLPIVLSDTVMQENNLNSKKRSDYDGDVNPGTRNGFAAAAFRFGHTLLSPNVNTLFDNGTLSVTTLHDRLFVKMDPAEMSGVSLIEPY